MTALVRLFTLPAHPAGTPAAGLFEGLEALSRAHSLEVIGSEDFVTSSEEFAAVTSDEDRRVTRIVAVADGGGRRIEELRGMVPGGSRAHGGNEDEGGPRWVPDLIAPAMPSHGVPGRDAVVGHLVLHAPLGDNTHRAEISVEVAASWRHSGLDLLMLGLGEAIARSWGRTTAWYWTDCPGWAGVDSPRAVSGLRIPVPGTDEQAAPVRTHETDMVAAAGYRPLHSEWVTTLDVGEALSVDPTPVPGYELVSWSSPRSPENLLDQLARIYALASTDMPSGELSEEPQVWDSQRVLRKEALVERSHQEWVLTAVRPVGGELVGWTTLVLSPTVPEIAYQEGTLVRADHRGHGLASWMKRVNLAELRARHPRVRRIHTWTDGANAPVIALNRRLGFRPSLVEVGWEKQLGVPGRGTDGRDE
ncbi:GNAT family N-acetyltransferase [Actinomyces polynesiensis]|uniref:GNAT family N-acetyltransferase n=1 Tax=Actinomyces polynesiensis TaxID=1325934 RepID=UPI000693E807|nr:GNAT family N-acetyltransferase [Actinomyces polynesiensis]